MNWIISYGIIIVISSFGMWAWDKYVEEKEGINPFIFQVGICGIALIVYGIYK